MLLAKLSEEYVINMDLFKEAIFEPADGDYEAHTTIYTTDGDKTQFYDDEAITVWHRLLDLCKGEAT